MTRPNAPILFPGYAPKVVLPKVDNGMSNHVFIVDDDAALGRLTSLALRSEGFEVAAFTSPKEALAEVIDPGAPNPSLVILDLSMPEMDGREFYRRARAAGLKAPVLILSAFGARAAQQELGAEAALAKPFDTEVLIQAVKTLRPEA
jgi:DNA-binding response OmpR family regulator